jgi:hypothetical protein
VTILVAVAVAGLSACGGDDDGGGGGASDGGNGGADQGCLTADQVQKRIDKIAGGFETSDEEVEAKQRAIRAVRNREC